MARVFGLLVVLTICGAADTAPPSDIGGTGHIEPRGGVVVIGGPGGARIRSIAVHAGQTVKRGQVLMLLDDTQARLDEKNAATALDIARKNASQTVAGEAISLNLAANHYRQAKHLADGYRSLGPEATSLSQRQTYDSAAQDAHGALVIERGKDAQVRASAAADVATAQNRLLAAQDILAKFQITAPSDGIILLVSQHEGELSSGGPLIELGDISQMYVTCQVFQGDLLKARPGLKATITSNAMNKTLTGTVVSVGRLIDTTTQTGNVRIRLNETDLASRLVGMEVEVKILL
ncbi:MAG TPA: efflux RND transporter periplasmic adaptor subunit [Rhizomicrobium sp.]|nr:efflux RND transporter periplasmic adaptor subunit [Rhizomicrobium sp.]